eukprot:1769441-Alexandrium_andersonii.AAC.1
MSAKVPPMALYACAASPASKIQRALLEASIATTLDPRAAGNRSRELALLAAFPTVLSPDARVLVARFVALHRACTLFPRIRQLVDEILGLKTQSGHLAC